jgi:hypothetical protein
LPQQSNESIVVPIPIMLMTPNVLILEEYHCYQLQKNITTLLLMPSPMGIIRVGMQVTHQQVMSISALRGASWLAHFTLNIMKTPKSGKIKQAGNAAQ